MFVTSDCHPLVQIAPYLPYEWREVLVAGVGVYGTCRPGALNAASFLKEAARVVALDSAMEVGGYTLIGENRTRNVKPNSLEKSINQAEGKGRGISGVLLSGVVPRTGAASASGTGLFVGGEVDTAVGGGGAFEGSFVYPERADSSSQGESLLRAAVVSLDAKYGYYFVRDDAFLPRGYALGMIGGLAAVRIEQRQELEELARWGELIRGGYWNIAHPPLRDIYEVNLLSTQHLEREVGAATLFAWIQADPERGVLVEVTPGRFLWKLNSRQVERVRPELLLAGVLFSRHERKYRASAIPRA